MQVYQELTKDKYGVTVVNTELTRCFNIFLTQEDIEAQYTNKVVASYYFTPSNFRDFGSEINSDSYIQLSTQYRSHDGAESRFILIEALMKDAVAGLADGQKLWPFDVAIDQSYDGGLISYNTYFKQFGVQYSGAKGGFIPAKLPSAKKLPIGIVNGIKRSFVNGCVAKLKQISPGVDLSVGQLSNEHTEAGCKLMKELGYTLDDLVVHDDSTNPSLRFEGLAACAAHVCFKAKLTDKHTEDLLKAINEWWSSL